jgi:hypothetical protein
MTTTTTVRYPEHFITDYRATLLRMAEEKVTDKEGYVIYDWVLKEPQRVDLFIARLFGQVGLHGSRSAWIGFQGPAFKEVCKRFGLRKDAEVRAFMQHIGPYRADGSF